MGQAALVVLSASTVRCPSCNDALVPARLKRHQALCCPELLDPDGWANSDQAVVLETIARLHPQRGAPERRFLELRFKGRGMSTAGAAAHLGWKDERARALIASALRAVPPVAEDAPVDTLYEDDELIVVDKPPHVPVTPRHRFRGSSMTNRVLSLCDTATACHRLDEETSGALLFAKTKAAARSLMHDFEHGRVCKVYVFLSSEEAAWDEIAVDDHLCVAPDAAGRARAQLCRADDVGARHATTRMRLLASSSGASVVLAAPITGRTHQVRLHATSAGLAVLGDAMYGDETQLIGRHALHAAAISFQHPVGGATIRVHAPLPADMRAVAEALGLCGDASLLEADARASASCLLEELRSLKRSD